VNSRGGDDSAGIIDPFSVYDGLLVFECPRTNEGNRVRIPRFFPLNRASQIDITGAYPDTHGSGDAPARPGFPDAGAEGMASAAATDLDAANATGMQLAIWKDGQIGWRLEVGVKGAVGSDPVTADTLFEVGGKYRRNV